MERIETFLVELCRRGRSGFLSYFPESMLVIRMPDEELTDLDFTTDTAGPKAAEVQELLDRHADASKAIAAVAGLRVKRLVESAGPRFSVGRTIENYVPIPAKSVSKLHAHIELSDGSIVVSDAGSKNGTEVAGTRLGAGESMSLAAGVNLRFGDVVVTYHTPASFCDFLEQMFPWAKP